MTENKLIATTGMVLTNGDGFATVVYLGKNDSADNWYEITEEEALRIEEEALRLQEGAEEDDVLFE